MIILGDNMSYTFRFRFVLPQGLGLDIDSNDLVIDNRWNIVMRSCEAEKL